ncbi:MAG: hypothetical protein AAFZ38_03155 [Myxococcota bacterium]
MARTNEGAEELGEPTIHVDELRQSREGDAAPSRSRMVRDIAVFQSKLFVDGLRDGMLMPVTLAAGVLGLVSKNRRATRVFYDVLELGFRTERWINLFQPIAARHLAELRERLADLRASLTARGELDAEIVRRLAAVEQALDDLEGVKRAASSGRR